MTIANLKVLVRMTFPNGAIIRMWDGSGPYLDAAGDLWQGVRLNEGLDQIESAMNGEAATLFLSLSGVDPEGIDLAFADLEAGNVIDGKVELLLQPLDQWDQPNGDAEVRFTGYIDNMPMDESAQEGGIVASITLEVANRFVLRTLTSGAVLSDVDQRARSAMINPSATPDRFAERIPGLSDKSIVWPRFS